MALRSQLYDEQVPQLIEQIELGQISTHLINTRSKTLALKKINITLSHLIEQKNT